VPKPIPILFVKSDLANRPGLSLQDVTDKAGHRTKRWKRTAQELKSTRSAKKQAETQTAASRDPDPEDRRGSARGYGTHDLQVGGRVKFKAGEHEGKGTITAIGKDGVTIKDAEGREHGIHHHELTHYASSDEQKRGGKPQPDGGEEGQAEPREPKKANDRAKASESKEILS
jgi:hypothetical protein